MWKVSEKNYNKNVSNLAEGLSNCEVITRSILMVLLEKGTLSKYE